ncbi:MAG TPA: hypothetical protein VJ780_11760 [Flavobacterium sp.]|nr:hypothetical protein [Flavobacterium sp.]
MNTILSQSVLNIVKSFSPEDMAAFVAEFDKMQKPIAKAVPKKLKPVIQIPSEEERIAYITKKYCSGS